MKRTIVSLATLLIAASILVAHLTLATDTLSSFQRFSSKTEALTQGELDPAVITCSSGDMGRCFIVYDAGNYIIYYACKYTGNQSDFCNWFNIIAKDLITIIL